MQSVIFGSFPKRSVFSSSMMVKSFACTALMAFMPIGDLQGHEDDAVVVTKMKEACHHNLYALANSIAMNGIGKDTTIKATTPAPIETLCMVRNVSLVLLAVFAIAWIIRGKQFRKTEAYSQYKAFKASMKKR